MQRVHGFTLLELTLVMAVAALLVAMVGRAIPSAADRQLREESLRLIAVLEQARALSRGSGEAVRLRLHQGGWEFQGAQTSQKLPQGWLYPGTQSSEVQLVLGPDPLIRPQFIDLYVPPGSRARVATDGVHPFVMESPP